MPLDRVTITGADDEIQIEEMLEISEQFPYVEWGILMSLSRQGDYRYPTKIWRDELASLADENRNMNISIHLCGQIARNWFAGGCNWREVGLLRHVAERIQVNGSSDSFSPDDTWLNSHHILQYPACKGIIEKGLYGFSVLFDESGGNGVPATVVTDPLIHHYCGYAGGINDLNIEERIDEIRRVRTGNFWIDMESGVRTDDELDMAKVRRVLGACEKYIGAPAGREFRTSREDREFFSTN